MNGWPGLRQLMDLLEHTHLPEGPAGCRLRGREPPGQAAPPGARLCVTPARGSAGPAGARVGEIGACWAGVTGNPAGATAHLGTRVGTNGAFRTQTFECTSHRRLAVQALKGACPLACWRLSPLP